MAAELRGRGPRASCWSGWPAATASRAIPTCTATSSASCSRARPPGCPSAALETLAIVAYKQPISRAQVAVDPRRQRRRRRAHARAAGLHRRDRPRPRARPGRAVRHHRRVPRADGPRLARRPAADRRRSCPAPTWSRRSRSGLRVEPEPSPDLSDGTEPDGSTVRSLDRADGAGPERRRRSLDDELDAG